MWSMTVYDDEGSQVAVAGLGLTIRPFASPGAAAADGRRSPFAGRGE
jgi:hypothetical protein